MKRCQMCGSSMSVAAELTEAERHYTWFKCLNISCGAVFLVQKSIDKTGVPKKEEQANAAAG